MLGPLPMFAFIFFPVSAYLSVWLDEDGVEGRGNPRESSTE